MRSPRIALLVLSLSILALAQFQPGSLRRQDAGNVVRDYLRFDYQGARLNPASWPRMQALTTWKSNPDWQAFTIVSQYEVVSADQGLRSAAVKVRYGVLGRFEMGVGYAPDRGFQTAEFRLRAVEDGGWKIEEQDPLLNPHVSRSRAVEWLQSALAAEKNAANKAAIESALKMLQGK